MIETPTPIDKRSTAIILKRAKAGVDALTDVFFAALPNTIYGMKALPDEALPDFFEAWVRADPFILRVLSYNERVVLADGRKGRSIVDKYFNLVNYTRAAALCMAAEEAVQAALLMPQQAPIASPPPGEAPPLGQPPPVQLPQLPLIRLPSSSAPPPPGAPMAPNNMIQAPGP